MSTNDISIERSKLSAAKLALLEQRLKHARARRDSAGADARRVITRREEGTTAPLSFTQQRLWFIDQLEPGSSMYNKPSAVRLTGRLDVGALGRTLTEIVRRHEVLRTRFVVEGDEPVQVVNPHEPLELPVIDLSGEEEGARVRRARELALTEARRPFDLTTGPLMRVSLLKLAEEEHLALFTIHHIAGDGWSIGVLMREVAALYRAFSEGRPSPLPELAIQYGDFAQWQRGWLAGEVLEAQLSYWKRQLTGAPAVLELPTDRPRPAAQTHRGARRRFALPDETAAAVKELCRREGVTLFMTLLAGWQALLSRYTGQEDIVVGTAVANRTQSETEGLIGFFANTLVMRTDLSGDPTFGELLLRVREVCLGAYAHQDLPFEKLVEELRPERSLSHSPLFQVSFGVENVPGASLELPGLKLNLVEQDAGQSLFDISLGLAEMGDKIEGLLEYSTDIFEDTTIERLAGHLRTLLAAAAAEPGLRLSELPLLTQPERQALAAWNDTRRDYPLDTPAHHLFERQAERTPDAVALSFRGRHLSYSELDERASRLAARLRSRGVGAESVVGVLLERSVESVVALLAVWKAGGAYLPLDPTHPAARLSFILSDAGAKLLITQQPLTGLLPEPSPSLLLLDEEGESPAGEDSPADVRPHDLAYVIYTSGSTGEPKGVEVEHRQLLNTLHGAQEVYRFTEGDAVPCFAPLTFDISLFELLCPLLAGGRVLLEDPRRALEAEEVVRLLSEVTFWHSAPGLMRRMLEVVGQGGGDYPELRALFVGGDAVAPELVRGMREAFPGAEVYVGYGPTEAAIMCAACRVEGGEEAEHHLVGRPMGNVSFRLLDRHGNPVPVGVVGEIYIGGGGVARGYLNREDLTRERFVELDGERYYKSGDLGRWLASGVVEFAGRADEQVKVRGFRVEAGEVEAALTGHAGVKQAVVVARGDGSGEKRLVAYYVAAEGAEAPAAAELREHLRGLLPEYMVPSVFVMLEALPLTPLGKVDRKALPEPEGGAASGGAEYVAPRTAVEEVLCGLWAELLKAEHVGVHDNFFDLGGHSLLATQLVSRVRDAFQTEVPLRALFEQPTVSGFAISVEAALRTGAGSSAPPLVPVRRGEALPLSFAQQRLWFIDQLQPGAPLYNMPSAVRLTGRLDVGALERTLTEIVRRHEALRTRFVAEGGEPIQVIDPPRPVELPVFDVSELGEEERERRARSLTIEEARRPFDLSAGPLLRASLIRLAEEEHVALLTVHHIVSDGWSMGVLMREVAALYKALLEGQPSPLAELPVQYADFAAWQRGWLAGDVLDAEVGYWRGRLAGAPAVLELPTDRPRPAVRSNRGARLSFGLSAEVSRGLKELSRREGVTLFMALLAGWQALLSRYSGQEDICVGTAIANRTRGETEPLIGFFTNTLVLRTDLSGDPTVRELLQRVREVCLGAYAHQDVPFEKLVEELRPERSLSHTPFFQVMFGLENVPSSSLELPGLQLSAVESDVRTAKFDLSLGLSEGKDAIHGLVEYNTDLFEAGTVERLLRHYEMLLEALAADPSRRVSELPLLNGAERRQLLVNWNGTRREYGADACLQELFERQAARTPEAAALLFEELGLTYAELDARANQLARHLRGLGVGPEVRVGICVERSIEMVVGLLGILKAGGAYVPLDPEYPQGRLAFMLEDARVPVLLTQERLKESLPEHAARVVCLDTDWPLVARQDAGRFEGGATPENLAYVIYTSGSTGRPKGAMNTHRAIANRLRWMQERYRLTGDDRVLQKTPFSFDVSVWEFFWPLLAGAQLVVARPGGHRESAYLVGLIRERQITTLHFVPSMLHVFLEERGLEACVSVRQVMCSGEALPVELQERFFARMHGAELHNLYGPTEAAVDVTHWQCEPGESRRSVPIGRPIANTQIYILDRHLRPVPVGVPGELYIGGVCLARGYLNRPALTAEKFIVDPFGEVAGGRLYRTGDLTRYLPGGEIEFLGRIDHQVKVRGFRIELGEIEAVLCQHPSVREAVVMAREAAAGDQRLVAYLVAEGGASADTGELRAYLKGKLPEYMVPSAFVVLGELPLSPNGKVDRKALPAPEGAAEAVREYVAPRTAVEEVLCGLWAELLKAERVGVHDNFFDLGGHSLLATQLVSRVRDAFQAEVPLRALFEQPTVSGFAISVEQALRAGSGSSAPPLVPVARDEALPLSFAQQRLWFIDQLQPGSSMYNMPSAVRLTGRLDVGALERTLTEIVRRHEALRTRFVVEGGEPIQVIDPPRPVELAVTDLSELGEEEREQRARELAAAEAKRPFDLSGGPLLRASLLRLADEDHMALLTVHHIVSDGWSTGVLMREVAALYKAFGEGRPSPLQELPIQYADFAHWQRNWLTGEVLDAEVGYWRGRLAGAPAALELPTDRPRPAVQGHRGARVSFGLSAEVSRGLKELSRREGVTLFMTLLAGWQALLSRYSGQEDVLVGTPIANRTRGETEPLIGFFVNTLVLRTDLGGDPTFGELLQRVREVCLGAYAHQDVPFEKLVEELQPERSLSHSPFFQVMFMLQNAAGGEVELPGLRLSPLGGEGGEEPVKFDLTLMMQESRGGLNGSVLYSTDIFEAATIERMVSHFQTLLAGAAAVPSRRVSELPLLGPDEERRIVVEWNRTRRDYPRELCIHQLFERQAERTPEEVALVCGEVQLTYGELNRRAGRLALQLRTLGVGPEVTVGVMMRRSAEMVVALLGVLKAGGAYVPLDPEYPRERLAFMLEDARAPVLLTQRHLVERLPEHEARVVCLDGEREESAAQEPPQESRDGLGVAAGARNLAYLIYTSGSTGRPKGVAIEHASAVTLIHWARENFAPGAIKGTLAATSISFDLSVFELFVPLSWGGKVILAQNALELPTLHAAREVTLVNTVPSAMTELVRLGGLPESVRVVNLAGEPLRQSLVEQVYALGHVERVLNLYGPSEDTTYSTWAEASKGAGREPTIGRPVANTEVYLLDRRLNPVPVGVAGELYIGGAGVARGYLGRPSLTAERFVPDHLGAAAGARLYRTGDLARYRADGEIEFLGRIDHQVKVRGFRIELGEIEAALLAHAAVREAVVLAREDAPGERRLVAYFAAEQGAELNSSELRTYLRGRLPEHMVPSAFVQLEALPLTPNGKVDRKALPVPEGAGADAGREYVAPRTAVEEVLCELWAELLKAEKVGVHDNFFELGGHSLLATQLVSRVREAFQAEVPLRALFEQPTVSGFAISVEAALRTGAGSSAPPLVPVRRGEALPLSFAQQRLWFIDQLQPGSPAYNLPSGVRLTGRLDVGALERTLTEIVRRHEALRTRFVAEGGEPIQVIDPPRPVELPVFDLSELGEEEREQRARSLTIEEARRPFDLSSGPLLRASLLRLADEEHVALLTVHHIVSDGWSMGVLMREVAALYKAFSAGQPSPLAELPVQYADFAAWQRGWLTGEVLEAEVGYWRGRLAGAPAALELPTDRPRPAVRNHCGARVQFKVAEEVSRGLKELSRREGVTPFMTLLAAFQALLSRYSGQEDVLVGTPIANRTRGETEPLIGFFVNTLVLRTDLGGDPTFAQLLQRVREVALGAYAHQDVPFEKLVEELQPERSLSHSPFFQVMFMLQNAAGGEVELPGLRLSPLGGEGGEEPVKFDLTLMMHESKGGLSGVLTYGTDIFDASTIERMVSHFQTLLAGAAAVPSRRVSELPLLGPDEKELLLRRWNRTEVEYPQGLVHQLFAEQAAHTPDATALVYGERRLSYAELDEKAERLAGRLRREGVGPESLVGVMLERTPEMVAALLAVLKAGGAYVPLDPSYPKERLRFMFDDAGLALLLTQTSMAAELPESGVKVLCVDGGWETAAEESAAASEDGAAGAAAENLAYVIYTSGSTGRPKGVMVTHGGLANYLAWATRSYPLASGQTVPVHSPIGFDLTVTSTFAPLLAGRALLLLPEAQGVEALGNALGGEGGFDGEGDFSLLKITPSHLEVLSQQIRPEAARRVGALVIGGEALLGESLHFWRVHSPETRLINEYGPTETVVGCCVYEVPPGMPASGAVPIGRPIANTQLYILDLKLQPVPVGAVGELYIGGAGVARGYLGRPSLTAERFVPDHLGAAAGARLYRTGDLARYRADGEIEFLGRIDHQVKVRGFRIELGEIEAVLCQHPAVREAVVVAREQAEGDKRLVAYFVAAEKAELNSSELRTYLRGSLPEHMVPSAFIQLDELPLTPNGKVDRKALPAPDRSLPGQGREFIAPRDVTELKLTEIWEEVLGVEPVGVRDSFFELGGHSLLATRLMARIEEALGQKLPLTALFRSPTIEHLAGLLRQREEGEGEFSSLVEIQAGRGGRPPLFFTHPSGGNVLCYAELARQLGADQPVYAFQAQALGDGLAPHTTVEEMAAHYVGLLRGVQPEGPYLLGGWSMGGVVAYEMAQMLQAQGQQVAMLTLFDVLPPSHAEHLPALARLAKRAASTLGAQDPLRLITNFGLDMGFSLRNLSVDRDELAKLSPDAQLDYVLDVGREAGVVPPGLDDEHLRRLFHVFKTNSEAMQNYVARTYKGRVTLFVSEDRFLKDIRNPIAGWTKLVPEGFQFQAVPGNHYTMIQRPHVQVLAERLRARLDKALAETNPPR